MLEKLRWYGFLGFLRLLRDTIYSRMLIPKCRIVRSPFYIRGWKEIDFGKNLTTGVGLRLDTFENEKKGNKIIIGENVQLNDYVHIAAIDSVIIEDHVLIASKVYISDHNHGSYSGSQHSVPESIAVDRPLYAQPVTIKRNAWIGESVTILPGVTIGENSIIGASSVVSKSIPDNCIAVGTPAKVIKKFDFSSGRWINIKNEDFK